MRVALVRVYRWLDATARRPTTIRATSRARSADVPRRCTTAVRKLGTIAVAPMILCEALLPSARRLFWHPQRFPIADAHYAMGFALLSRFTGERRVLRAGGPLPRSARATRCPGYRHHGWGYPFDWVTRTGVMAAGRR